MKKRVLSSFLFFALLLASCGTAGCGERNGTTTSSANHSPIVDTTPVAETEYGKVAGYRQNGINIFKGIPYAKAERFMAPTAPDSWEGVRSSRAYGPTCPQGKRMGWYSDEQAFAFDWDDGFADENCLRVNVWTPGVADGRKRPVMVWLHGGGFSAGSGQELPSYDGANLARTGDVVVVTLNHRLNVLGHLDLSAYGDKYANSGNAGLLDLVAALQWVKNNIEDFGGDAGNVTIFGQSGGGGKVSMLLATPSARGLFHKAIIQSGSMVRTMTPEHSRRIGAAVLEELHLSPSQVDSLQTMPYDRLLGAGNKAVERIKANADAAGENKAFIFGWAPVVDGEVLPQQPFDNKAPEQSRDIPVMLGTTLHEFTASTYVPAIRTMDKDAVLQMLSGRYGDKLDDYVAAFEKAYPEYQPKDLIDVDIVFRPSALALAKAKADQQGAPVYMYMFAWESPVMDGILRSTHCMEIPFVFNNTGLHATMTGGGNDAQALADKMSAAWINFVRTGNPNADGLPLWEPYTPADGATMFFDNECTVRHNHDKELMDVVMSFPVRGF